MSLESLISSCMPAAHILLGWLETKLVLVNIGAQVRLPTFDYLLFTPMNTLKKKSCYSEKDLFKKKINKSVAPTA